MKQFHVPSEYIERLAIEQAARSNAWLVIPKCIDREYLETLIYQLGFGDCVDVTTWDRVPKGEAVVMLYPDLIFGEFAGMGSDGLLYNTSSLFFENDVV